MKYGVRVTFSDDRGDLILEVCEDQNEAFRRAQMHEQLGNISFVINICAFLGCSVAKYDVVGIGT